MLWSDRRRCTDDRTGHITYLFDVLRSKAELLAYTDGDPGSLRVRSLEVSWE